MSHPKQSDKTFEEVNKRIWDYLKARDWHQQPPRSLVISLALEANELLEHYQWSDMAVGDKKALAAELADVMIYAFQFAQTTEIDIVQAIEDKLVKTEKKYPAENFKGVHGEDRRQAWLKSKAAFKKDDLL